MYYFLKETRQHLILHPLITDQILPNLTFYSCILLVKLKRKFYGNTRRVEKLGLDLEFTLRNGEKLNLLGSFVHVLWNTGLERVSLSPRT